MQFTDREQRTLEYRLRPISDPRGRATDTYKHVIGSGDPQQLAEAVGDDYLRLYHQTERAINLAIAGAPGGVFAGRYTKEEYRGEFGYYALLAASSGREVPESAELPEQIRTIVNSFAYLDEAARRAIVTEATRQDNEIDRFISMGMLRLETDEQKAGRASTLLGEMAAYGASDATIEATLAAAGGTLPVAPEPAPVQTPEESNAELVATLGYDPSAVPATPTISAAAATPAVGGAAVALNIQIPAEAPAADIQSGMLDEVREAQVLMTLLGGNRERLGNGNLNVDGKYGDVTARELTALLAELQIEAAVPPAGNTANSYEVDVHAIRSINVALRQQLDLELETPERQAAIGTIILELPADGVFDRGEERLFGSLVGNPTDFNTPDLNAILTPQQLFELSSMAAASGIFAHPAEVDSDEATAQLTGQLIRDDGIRRG